MFARISNSWQLVKASWNVLLADKELLLFPVVSFIASIVVIATFAVPTILAGVFDETIGGGVGILSYIVAFLFYVVMYTVTIFANSALVGAAMIRLEGGDPTVSDGFRIAFKHFGAILTYALIAATVGTILQAISEKAGWLGRLLVSLVGFVWQVATFLVVPILVVEGVSPIDAIKRSGNMVKETWGEQLVGNFSIGTITGLSIFGIILLGIPVMFVSIASGSTALIITAVVGLILAIIAVSLISSALSGIYTAAVYRYATTGDTGGYFDADLIKKTFKQK